MKKTIQISVLMAALLLTVSVNMHAQTAKPKDSTYKDFVGDNPTADKDIKIVGDFVNALVAADFTRARSLMATGYKGFGPGPLDSANTEQTIANWKANDSTQSDKKVDFAPVTFRVFSGNEKGNWVTMWGNYSFGQNGKTVKFPFQYTAHVTNGKIDYDVTYFDRLYIMQALGYTLTPPAK